MHERKRKVEEPVVPDLDFYRGIEGELLPARHGIVGHLIDAAVQSGRVGFVTVVTLIALLGFVYMKATSPAPYIAAVAVFGVAAYFLGRRNNAEVTKRRTARSAEPGAARASPRKARASPRPNRSRQPDRSHSAGTRRV